MNTAAVVLIGILVSFLYFKYRSSQGEKLKNDEQRLRLNDLELARKAKDLNTDINTIKKQLAESQSNKNMTDEEVEDFWRNH